MSTFTKELWSSIKEDVYPAILAHPFLKGLVSGELDETAFRFYVEQDSLYLADFGRGLARLAARAPGNDDFMMFCEHARNTLVVENALHAGFIQHWSGEERKNIRKAPTTILYTSFLLRSVHEDGFAEALASFLPCYWIYREVGRELIQFQSPNELYQRWIDTYGGEEFSRIVDDVIALTNRIAASADASTRQRMLANFRQTSVFEYLFWDMGYRQEAWPEFGSS